jgi:hypothetical protein
MSRFLAPIRRLPRPFRNIWWATGLFVLLTWADEQLGVVRSPRGTAWLVLLFAAFALRLASRAFMPMAMLSLILTVVGIVLLNQPMGMRHGP